MNPVQYIILNKGLGMSTGKAAAQAAHASVEGVRISAKTPNGNPWDSSIVNRWYRGGHYAKIVLEVEDQAALQVAYQYITDRGFKAHCIIDEGRTEFDPQSLTLTAIGCEIVDKDWPHARETFSAFKLYKDEPTWLKLPELSPDELESLEDALQKVYDSPAKPYPDVFYKEGTCRPNWLQRAAAKMHAKADELERGTPSKRGTASAKGEAPQDSAALDDAMQANPEDLGWIR